MTTVFVTHVKHLDLEKTEYPCVFSTQAEAQRYLRNVIIQYLDISEVGGVPYNAAYDEVSEFAQEAMDGEFRETLEWACYEVTVDGDLVD